MKIDINTSGFEHDNELSHFTNCCAAFELGPQREYIAAVRIQLAQLQLSPDPKNRHCVVEVDMSDGNTVVSRDADLDLHIAIYRALEQAGWMCARRLSKEDIDAGILPFHLPPATHPGESNRAA